MEKEDKVQEQQRNFKDQSSTTDVMINNLPFRIQFSSKSQGSEYDERIAEVERRCKYRLGDIVPPNLYRFEDEGFNVIMDCLFATVKSRSYIPYEIDSICDCVGLLKYDDLPLGEIFIGAFVLDGTGHDFNAKKVKYEAFADQIKQSINKFLRESVVRNDLPTVQSKQQNQNQNYNNQTLSKDSNFKIILTQIQQGLITELQQLNQQGNCLCTLSLALKFKSLNPIPQTGLITFNCGDSIITSISQDLKLTTLEAPINKDFGTGGSLVQGHNYESNIFIYESSQLTEPIVIVGMTDGVTKIIIEECAENNKEFLGALYGKGKGLAGKQDGEDAKQIVGLLREGWRDWISKQEDESSAEDQKQRQKLHSELDDLGIFTFTIGGDIEERGGLDISNLVDLLDYNSKRKCVVQ